MHSFESLTQDEHLNAIGFFRKVDHPVEGEMIDMAHPNRFSSGLREDCRPAPLVGADSRAIAGELGYSEAQIDALLEVKALIGGRAC